MALPSSKLTLSELRKYIEKTSEFKELDKAISSSGWTGLGNMGATGGGMAIVEMGQQAMTSSGGVGTAPALGRWWDTATTASPYYESLPAVGGAVTPYCSPEKVEWEYISTHEVGLLRAKIEEQEKLLSEKQEIIEALSIDINEIDSLREENEKLKGIVDSLTGYTGIPPVKTSHPASHPWYGGDCPVDHGRVVTITLRSGGVNTGQAGIFYWHHTFSSSDIVEWRYADEAPLPILTDSDGFTMWYGGECPVDPDRKVAYKMGYGGGDNYGCDAFRLRWQWLHQGKETDIVSYKVISP